MKRIKIWLYFLISIIFYSCYSTEGISYKNEQYDILKNYTNNDIWDNELLSYYNNDKIFYINLSSEVYFNVTFDNRQLRNKYKYFTVFLQISSKVIINNIKINNCEIEFNNYKIKFDNNDLKYYINKYYLGNNINYEIIFSKNIKKEDYKKYILNVIKKSKEQKDISVEINLEYIENDEIINYTFNTKLNSQYYQDWYTPSNLWGWLKVNRKYKIY
jgi:hypothetical protein